MDLYETIKKIADERGLTIADVERGANLSRRTIARWSQSVPSVDKAAAVADFFGITLEELMGKSAPEQGADAGLMTALERAFNERPEMRTLFSLAENATPEDVEKAIKIIEALQDD